MKSASHHCCKSFESETRIHNISNQRKQGGQPYKCIFSNTSLFTDLIKYAKLKYVNTNLYYSGK